MVRERKDAKRRQKLATPPIIANPAAKALLEQAASATGLTIPQLADLVFEAGVVEPKPKDKTIQKFTLEDLGERLWTSMQSVTRDQRAGWLQSLVPTQRAALITVLRDKGYRSEVIAMELGIPVDDVVRTWNEYAAKLGSQVVGVRLESIAGQLLLAQERATEMALQVGDHSAYWRINKEYVEILQSIGIVDRAIHRVEHTHALDDSTKAEIEELFKLRRKQETRRIEVEEIKQLEKATDEVPIEITEDYDE